MAAELRDKATPFYFKLGILKLTDFFKLEVGKFVHAHFKNKLPPSLSEYFILTSEVLQKNTRSTQPRRDCLYISRYASNRMQKCIRFQARADPESFGGGDVILNKVEC